jgi:hypothetical protein
MMRGGRSSVRTPSPRPEAADIGLLGYRSVSEMSCMVTPVTARENVNATGARWSVASGRSSPAVECPDSPDWDYQEIFITTAARGRYLSSAVSSANQLF